jgi:hypothetical protein
MKNPELTLSLRTLCRTENFKALRPVNLEKHYAYHEWAKWEELYRILKLPIRII